MERKFYLRGLGLGIAVTAIIMGTITSQSRGMSDKEIIARAKELGMVENTVLSEDSDGASGEADESEAGSGDAGSAGEENADEPGEEGDIRNSTEAEDTMPFGVANEAESTARVDAAAGEVNGGKTDSSAREDNATDLSGAGMTVGNASAGEANRSESGTAREDGTGTASEAETEEDARDLITSAAVKTITVNRGDGSHTVAKKLADAGVVTSAENFDAFLCQNGYDKRLRTGTFSIPADASDEQIARIVTGAE